MPDIFVQTLMDTRKRVEIQEQAARTAYLLFNYLQNNLTEEEDGELAAWMLENEQNWKLFQEFTGEEFKKKFSKTVDSMKKN